MKSRLSEWLKARGTKNRSGEGFDHVVCKICNRAFKSISYLHLVRKHHFAGERPQQRYKERFGLILVESVETIRKRRRSQNIRFESLGRRWTKARVKAEIRSLAAEGGSINHDCVKKTRSSLGFAARSLFGSWSRALAACRIDARKVRLTREWTRQTVVQTISNEARRGKPMNYTAMKSRDVGLVMAAVLRFGSWDSALCAARLDPSKVRRRRIWTRDRVLGAIRRHFISHPNKGPERSLRAAAQYHFGGWYQATIAAGLDLPPPVRWTQERILAEINLRWRRGVSLRRAVIEREMSGLLAAAGRVFGSWQNAIQTAGLPRRLAASSQPWTRQELIRLLRKLNRDHGRVDRKLLSVIRRDGYGTPLWSIRKIFGSEGLAKRAAGVK